jgi:hypothetical protein
MATKQKPPETQIKHEMPVDETGFPDFSKIKPLTPSSKSNKTKTACPSGINADDVKRVCEQLQHLSPTSYYKNGFPDALKDAMEQIGLPESKFNSLRVVFAHANYKVRECPELRRVKPLVEQTMRQWGIRVTKKSGVK